MRIGLSPILQSKLNIFLYLTFGWKIAWYLIYLIGKMYFYANKSERNHIENAVFEVMGRMDAEANIKKITKKVFNGILSHYYEKMFIAFEDPEKATKFMKQNIVSEDLEILRRKLLKGNGVIVVTGHYGAIEYIPTLLAIHGLPVSMIAKFKTEQLRKKVYAQAEKYRITLIDGNRSGNIIRSAINELRENRIVITQCDEIEEWRPSYKDKMSFLGRITGGDRTINIIQKRTSAEVIFGIIHRYSLNQYKLIMYSYDDMLALIKDASNASVGATILKFLERFIYTYPEQWYQWKKYSEIKNISGSDIRVERQTSSRFLKPAFGKF